MIITWDGPRCLADADALAVWNRVSERTVRRRCTPIRYHADTGAALYDAHLAADQLAAVTPRPGGTAAARRARTAAGYSSRASLGSRST